MFHIHDVVREEVSRLPFPEQSPELREGVRRAQEGSQGTGTTHPFEYDFRGRAKVNQNPGGPKVFQRSRDRDPATAWGEDHPAGRGQLPGEVELEGAESGLSLGTEEFGYTAPGPPLDLLIEIEEPPPKRLRHRLPHRRLPGAREPRQDQVRRISGLRRGHQLVGGLIGVGVGLGL